MRVGLLKRFSLHLRPRSAMISIRVISRVLMLKPFPRIALLGALVLALPSLQAVEGLPATRSYSYDEIGHTAQGNALGFDAYGRVTLSAVEAYNALTDERWENQLAPHPDVVFEAIATDRNGETYYGSLASWGRLVRNSSGLLEAVPLNPESLPEWVLATRFSHVLFTPEAVCFSGFNGVVYLHRASGRQHFHPARGVSRVYLDGDEIHLSTHMEGNFRFEQDGSTLIPHSLPYGHPITIRVTTREESGDLVFASTAREMFRKSSNGIHLLNTELGANLPGPVMALQALPGGNLAVALGGQGIFILDHQGRILSRLTSSEFSDVSVLACNEPGVLWAQSDRGVTKILYDAPFTVVDQSLGLPVEWPQLVQWNGRTVVSSGGRIYEEVNPGSGTTTLFARLPEEPIVGGWGIAASGDTLLIGNGEGAHALVPGGRLQTVVSDLNVARIVATDTGVCYLIGQHEIAAMRQVNGRWQECAPRVQGHGYPSITRASRTAAWVELGVNRAMRIELKDDALEVRLIEDFPWEKPSWVHISMVDDRAILGSHFGERIYFNELTGRIEPAPDLDALLAASPKPVSRALRDNSGLIWAAYENGLVTIDPRGGTPRVDARTFSGLTEHVLQFQTTGDQVWISGGQTLYAARPRERWTPIADRFHPRLVSATAGNTDLTTLFAEPGSIPSFAYSENSPALLFFSGSFSRRRFPEMEFRLNDGPWRPHKAGTPIQLTNLREGSYHLEVRALDAAGPLGSSTVLGFDVSPPWYRAWYAWFAYPALAFITVVVGVRIGLRRAEARNARLESLVEERTRELKLTMEKLEQETRISATLAERNRLAQEIHDSVEQGFTGLAMQLEATAHLPSCHPQVQSGLKTAMSMVSFSRNEVRNVVQNLHSASLESGNLEQALRVVLDQFMLPADFAHLTVSGDAISLGTTVEHHLVRFAQEALTNVVKHAQATRVDVELHYTPSAVSLTVRDNGIGFDVAEKLRHNIGHFGLPSLHSRADRLGGRAMLTSNPGHGTTVHAHIPLNHSL